MFLFAALSAMTAYTTWLAVAWLALITLRKGYVQGTQVLAVVLLARFAVSLAAMMPKYAALSAIMTFLPCFMAALVLRYSQSWRAVSALFFVQVLLAALWIQVGKPNFIMAQYLLVQDAIRALSNDGVLSGVLIDSTRLNEVVLANYLFGVQAAGVCISSALSLMLARAMQARLFNPGGFKQEMRSFRGDKIGLILLVVMVVAASDNHLLAINVIPVLIGYFVFAGMSLAAVMFARKKAVSTLCLLVVPMLLTPFVILPLYALMGMIDSLFNIRLYLPAQVGNNVRG